MAGTGGAKSCDDSVPFAPAAVDAQFWNLLASADPDPARKAASVAFASQVRAACPMRDVHVHVHVHVRSRTGGPVHVHMRVRSALPAPCAYASPCSSAKPRASRELSHRRSAMDALTR